MNTLAAFDSHFNQILEDVACWRHVGLDEHGTHGDQQIQARDNVACMSISSIEFCEYKCQAEVSNEIHAQHHIATHRRTAPSRTGHTSSCPSRTRRQGKAAGGAGCLTRPCLQSSVIHRAICKSVSSWGCQPHTELVVGLWREQGRAQLAQHCGCMLEPLDQLAVVLTHIIN